MTATLTSTDIDEDRCPKCGASIADVTGAVAMAAEQSGRIAEQIEIDRLRAAIRWALGEAPDDNGKWFGDDEPKIVPGQTPKRFWWRTNLRRMSGDQQAPTQNQD